jgi:hypothetical protein
MKTNKDKSLISENRFGLTQSLLDAVKSVVTAEAGDNKSIDKINASKLALKASKEAARLAAEIEKDSKLDPVDDDEVDKDFVDRTDKDIDNDGDVDDSDEYLHKRRAATDDAIDAKKDKTSDEDIDINVMDDDDDEDEKSDADDEKSDDEDEVDDEKSDDEDEVDDEKSDDEDEKSDDEDEVDTRKIGDLSDDELEKELEYRKNKSDDKEEVDTNPKVEQSEIDSTKSKLMEKESYYRAKYGTRWETIVDKMVEKLSTK